MTTEPIPAGDEGMLFGGLPHVERLTADELHFIEALPEWPTTQALPENEEPLCRRLERRGLVKVSREKTDPIAIRPTYFAGSTDAGHWLARRERRRSPNPHL